MIVLDTNAVLRFLLQDNSEMADFVEDQMLRNEYLIPIEVVSEAIYVLDKVYKSGRDSIQQLFHIILCDENSSIPYQNVVEKAIRVYGETKFDFVDCLMIGYANVEGYDVITFDKKLNNYIRNHS